MLKIKIINGDALQATEEYLAHQCNCVTNASKHMAKSMFDKYPYANTYVKRSRDKSTYNTPGTIEVLGNGTNQRYIINMYSQYYPSTAKYNNDSTNLRIQWFQQCLKHISLIPNIKNIAMPYNIGCGSAGGDWNVYFKMISDFAEKYNIDVVLYKLDV